MCYSKLVIFFSSFLYLCNPPCSNLYVCHQLHGCVCVCVCIYEEHSHTGNATQRGRKHQLSASSCALISVDRVVPDVTWLLLSSR